MIVVDAVVRWLRLDVTMPSPSRYDYGEPGDVPANAPAVDRHGEAANRLFDLHRPGGT